MVDKATDTAFLLYFPQDELPELVQLLGGTRERGGGDYGGQAPSPTHPNRVRPPSAASSRPPSSARPTSAARPQSGKRPLSAHRPGSASQATSKTRTPSATRPVSATKPPEPAGPRPVFGDNTKPKSPSQTVPINKRRATSPNKPRSTSPNKSRPSSPIKSRPSSPNKKAAADTKQKPKSPTPAKSNGTRKSKEKKSDGKSGSSNFTADGFQRLDVSSQGLTALPTHILSNSAIGELNISSNNLRSLPPEVNSLVNLRKLDISKNGLKCVHEKDFSGLPLELAELTRLEELYISECNLPFVPPVIWVMSALTVLDISRNKINVLPADIGKLRLLQKLNLQQTSITALPAEIAHCERLEELLLYGNALQSLPETLADLPSLRVLAVNYRSFCHVIDSYMENLIQRGQISSEHIPLVVFEMPALENLDLESTKINTVPDMYMDKIQEFSLYKNFIYEMPDTICKQKTLQKFDISKNFLKVLPQNVCDMANLTVLKVNDNAVDKMPPSIGKLVHLEELEMGGNKIRHLPGELKNLVCLRRLVLDRNDIQSIPSEICSLTELETLDVSENSIKYLPIMLYSLTKLTVAHTYRGLHKHGLWLYRNPLCEPPPEVWKTDKTQDIFNYLKKVQISRTENLQRQKVLLLGCSGAGKSSLMEAMVFGRTTQDDELYSKTKLLDQVTWQSDNSVKFVVYDIAGDEVYSVVYPLFLDRKALALIVFDASVYTSLGFQEAIGQWLDVLNEHSPGCVVKIVGTKLDLCDPVDITEESVWSEVNHHLEQRQHYLQQELGQVKQDKGDLEGMGERDSSDRTLLSQREEVLQTLVSRPLRVLPGVSLITSREDLHGIQELLHDIEIQIIDRELFPHAQRYIPESWHKLRAALKRRKSLYLHWTEVEDIAKRYQLTGSVLTECLQYLHDIGEVLWFQQIPPLRQILFQKPRSLVDVICTLYSYDTTDFLVYEDSKVFSSKGGLMKGEFDQAKELFDRYGQISRSLLNCFWFYLELDNQTFQNYVKLFPKLSLCYAIPEPAVPQEKPYLSPLLVLPWFNSDSLEEPPDHMWSERIPNGYSQVLLDYSFSLTSTSGIFETVICSAQILFVERTDWQNMVLGTCENTVSVLIRKVGRDVSPDGVQHITVCLRNPDLPSLQEAVGGVHSVMEQAFSQREGLYWSRTLETHNCHQSHFTHCFSRSHSASIE